MFLHAGLHTQHIYEEIDIGSNYVDWFGVAFTCNVNSVNYIAVSGTKV